MRWKGLIDKYRDYLPITDKTPVVTLNEGNTPLIYAEKLSKLTKCKIYLKYEGMNPTGSFKDRGMTVAISKAAEKKFKAVICASTGNTSASAAAYSGRAGIDCIVIIPSGKIALGKLAQASAGPKKRQKKNPHPPQSFPNFFQKGVNLFAS